MTPSRPATALIIIWGCLLAGLMSAAGHVVEQLYADWREAGESWQLEVQFDAGYAMPATRDNPEIPPPSRDWLLGLTSEQWSQLRLEAERYLRSLLLVRVGGQAVDYAVTFPDWEVSPPNFPALLNDVAYFRVVVTGPTEGAVELAIVDGTFPKLAINRSDDLLLLVPGESLTAREGKMRTAAVREGVEISFPLGWAALLPVIVIFCCWRKWWR